MRFMAGGTTLIDLMKLNVETPARLLDINRLPLDKIETTPDGGLKIGATVRNSDLGKQPDGAKETIRCCRRRFCTALRRSSATWRRPPAICCSARAASTSAIPRCPATSASRAPAARRSPATIARSPFWARANIASRRTPRTCAWRWRRWRRRSMFRDTNGIARDSLWRFSSSARQHAAPRNGARARRPHHSRHAAAADCRKQAGVSETARPSVL